MDFQTFCAYLPTGFGAITKDGRVKVFHRGAHNRVLYALIDKNDDVHIYRNVSYSLRNLILLYAGEAPRQRRAIIRNENIIGGKIDSLHKAIDRLIIVTKQSNQKQD